MAAANLVGYRCRRDFLQEICRRLIKGFRLGCASSVLSYYPALAQDLIHLTGTGLSREYKQRASLLELGKMQFYFA